MEKRKGRQSAKVSEKEEIETKYDLVNENELTPQQYLVINEWLELKFGSKLPPFEVNYETLTILLQIVARNQLRNQQISALIFEMETSLADLKIKTKQLIQQNENLGFGEHLKIDSSENINSLYKDYLISLSSLAVTLGIKNGEINWFFNQPIFLNKLFITKKRFLKSLQELQEEKMKLERSRQQNIKKQEQISVYQSEIENQFNQLYQWF